MIFNDAPNGCTTPDAGQLIPSISIAHLLQQRDAVVERIEQARRLLCEADAIARAAGLGVPGEILHELACNRGTLQSNSDDVLKAIDAIAWRHLMSATGLRSFMDQTARKEWQEQIHARKTPPLTRDNIEATFAALYEQRGDMFERGVIAVFRSLSWEYKTNTPVAFGNRVIMRGLFAYGYLNHYGTDRLDDLARVFHVLDGKPEPDYRSSMNATLWQVGRERTSEWEGPYFHLRWFKNGNAHITFRRLDLVERMNAILAKHFPGALPAGRRA